MIVVVDTDVRFAEKHAPTTHAPTRRTSIPRPMSAGTQVEDGRRCACALCWAVRSDGPDHFARGKCLGRPDDGPVAPNSRYPAR